MEEGDIPVVDVGPFFFEEATDEDAKRAVAAQVYHALHNVGFMYVRNVRCPSAEAIAEAFALSRAFFARERSDKDLFAWGTDNIGYVAVMREKYEWNTFFSPSTPLYHLFFIYLFLPIFSFFGWWQSITRWSHCPNPGWTRRRKAT